MKSMSDYLEEQDRFDFDLILLKKDRLLEFEFWKNYFTKNNIHKMEIDELQKKYLNITLSTSAFLGFLDVIRTSHLVKINYNYNFHVSKIPSSPKSCIITNIIKCRKAKKEDEYFTLKILTTTTIKNTTFDSFYYL